ncbi:MAG: glycosyltransferase family 4 protein [Myxococcales bacterium]|nr:glycosyltransferase family 4 protein [Myxococcales bacterium]
MHTLGTFIEPGIEAGGRGADGLLVGRRVANDAFLRALIRHADVARFLLFVGEEAQRPGVQQFVNSLNSDDAARVEVAHRLTLPDRLAAGEISVLHHESHWGWFFDLVALRDRFASVHVPVTGQIHSLSYPRMLESYLRGVLAPPGPGDAVFCSSAAGLAAFEASWKYVAERCGSEAVLLNCEKPLIPLGVDLDSLDRGAQTFPRDALRARLGLSSQACVVLSMGRFSEYDKMDLFPVVRSFSWLVHSEPSRDLHLVLAGARQGTSTSDMVALWAAAMGVADRVHLVIDFPPEEKGGWLSAADVFVSASDNVQETFGLSVIEAMAMGLPVVVSDLDGYRDTVTDKDVGLRVRTRPEADLGLLRQFGMTLFERPLHLLLGQSVSVDPLALQAALATLCGDGEVRRAMGERARSRARVTYGWERVVPRYEEVWRRLRQRAPQRVQAEPFALDFGHVFAGHFAPPEHAAEDRPLRLFGDPNAMKFHVHPELRSLFTEADVSHALGLLRGGTCTRAELRERLHASRFERSVRGTLAAQLMVSWLLKQGLVCEH